MAVNVPLVHISELAEQTTAADTDYMIIGGADAKKIKWSTIISLIKAKLNIGSSAISGIGDGTITGAISSLNSSFQKQIKFYSYWGYIDIPSGASKSFTITRDKFKLPSNAYVLFASIGQTYDGKYNNIDISFRFNENSDPVVEALFNSSRGDNISFPYIIRLLAY